MSTMLLMQDEQTSHHGSGIKNGNVMIYIRFQKNYLKKIMLIIIITPLLLILHSTLITTVVGQSTLVVLSKQYFVLFVTFVALIISTRQDLNS